MVRSTQTGEGLAAYQRLALPIIAASSCNAPEPYGWICCGAHPFERRLIQERTRAGLAAARARGRRGGRRALQPGDPKVQLAYTMYVDHRWSIEELCATLGISRATCDRDVALAPRAVAEG
jgi:hypothetical protein